MSHEGQLHHADGVAFAADVGEKPGSGGCKIRGHVAHADRPVYSGSEASGGDGADGIGRGFGGEELRSRADRAAVGLQAHAAAFGNGFKLGTAALGDGPLERSFDRRCSEVYVIAVQAQTRFQAQGVARTQTNGLHFGLCQQGLGEGQRPSVAGLFAEGRVETGSTQGLTLPESALVRNGDEVAVWVLRQDKLQRQVIGLGARDDRTGDYAVAKGLAEGDRVLRHPTSTLQAGQPVKVLSAKDATAIETRPAAASAAR